MSWDDLESAARSKREGRAEQQQEERRRDLLFASLFQGPDGAEALRHLREITIERRTGPEISESALRHLEGQRFLVHQIETWIARGNGPDHAPR